MYEATNIHSILECKEKGRDKTPLWFMYVTAAVQLLMVRDNAYTVHMLISVRPIPGMSQYTDTDTDTR